MTGRIVTAFGTARSAIIDGRDGIVIFITYTYPLDETAYQNILAAAMKLGTPTSSRHKMFKSVYDELCWQRQALDYCLTRRSGHEVTGEEVNEFSVHIVRAKAKS